MTLRQCNAESSSDAACMAVTPTHNNTHRASANRNTAQADFACRITEHITILLIYNFPSAYLTEFDSILPRKCSIGRFFYVNFSVILFILLIPPV